MPGKEKCSQCMFNFSLLKLPRKLPCCQHSICQPCIREIIETNQELIICGFCTSRVHKENIKNFSLNTSILLSLSQTPIITQPQRNEEQNQLLNDLPLSTYTSSRQLAGSNLCPIHRAPLDIVCISDKQRICAHCALFGNHREHRFKRLDDFEREVAEKKRAFVQIQSDKHKAFQNDFFKLDQQLKSKIELKRAELGKIIEDQFKKYELQLRKRKETAFHEIDVILSDYQQDFRKNGPMAQFQKIKGKLQQWEKTCLQNLYRLDSTKRVEDRLYYYYQGPLQIVTQGYIFIEQLNKYNQEALSKVREEISDIKIKFDQKAAKWFENCVQITKGSYLFTKSELRLSGELQEDDTNPFLDCTSSAIILNKSSLINHNSSIQAQINSISTSKKRINIDSLHTPARKETKIKCVRSIQRERPSVQSSNLLTLKKPLVQIQTPKTSAQNSKRPTSELNFKSPAKVTKQKVQNEQQNKQVQFKQPQKIYLQFTKNTLSDFFDLSECNLPSDKVVEYVHRARRIHKIRGLKICNNKLTTSGFEKMTQFLQGVSNINAANNLMNEGIFDVILKYRDRLDSLKVINLSHNPIHIDVKTLGKIQEVKKLNIVITL